MDANQSRPRAQLGRDGKTASAESISANGVPVRPRKNSLAYKGLPLDSKTFRLIQIEPSAQLEDRISCRLSVVPFGARPKYQALSYVWGNATAGETIDVNGIASQVGANFLGALRFLRFMQKYPVPIKDGFWIDAICINQSDVDEKNTQLGLMEHIYSRAKSVLVWLGEIPPPTGTLITAKERAMFLENPYWDRLWILQELGRFPDRDEEGPFKLHWRVIRPKFASLERLLCDHIDAKCSNPLDKIYGLLGLASDGAGFPVDYRKSRFGVWRDTISFIGGTVTTDLTAMARLIKELLTRQDLVDPQAHQPEPFRRPAPREKDSKPNADVPASATQGLTLTVAVMGAITKMGPPVGDCIDEPLQWRDWSHQVQKSFGDPDDKDGALRANDKLLTALLELDDAPASNLCSGRAGPHTWEATDALLRVAEFSELLLLRGRPADRPEDLPPRFCVFKGGCVSDRPMAPGKRLGLVPGVARPGGMLCRVRNSSKALLVRTMVKQDSPNSPDNTSGGATSTMYVRGVATVAEDVGPEPPDYNRRWGSVQTFPMMRVILDPETLLQLIE